MPRRIGGGRSQNKTAAETCLRCRELLSAGVEGLIPCKTSGWARSFLGPTSRAWLFQEIQQAFVNRVMIRLVPGDLSSVSQDLHSAFGVLAPSAFAGIEATRATAPGRRRTGGRSSRQPAARSGFWCSRKGLKLMTGWAGLDQKRGRGGELAWAKRIICGDGSWVGHGHAPEYRKRHGRNSFSRFRVAVRPKARLELMWPTLVALRRIGGSSACSGDRLDPSDMPLAYEQLSDHCPVIFEITNSNQD